MGLCTLLLGSLVSTLSVLLFLEVYHQVTPAPSPAAAMVALRLSYTLYLVVKTYRREARPICLVSNLVVNITFCYGLLIQIIVVFLVRAIK
jgi:hypothetical protein